MGIMGQEIDSKTAMADDSLRLLESLNPAVIAQTRPPSPRRRSPSPRRRSPSPRKRSPSPKPPPPEPAGFGDSTNNYKARMDARRAGRRSRGRSYEQQWAPRSMAPPDDPPRFPKRVMYSGDKET